jgi:hypothetical protein
VYYYGDLFSFLSLAAQAQHENWLFIICESIKIVVIKYKNGANLFFGMFFKIGQTFKNENLIGIFGINC